MWISLPGLPRSPSPSLWAQTAGTYLLLAITPDSLQVKDLMQEDLFPNFIAVSLKLTSTTRLTSEICLRVYSIRAGIRARTQFELRLSVTQTSSSLANECL